MFLSPALRRAEQVVEVDNLNTSNINSHLPRLGQGRAWWRSPAGRAETRPGAAFGGGAPGPQPVTQSPASGHGSGGVGAPGSFKLVQHLA